MKRLTSLLFLVLVLSAPAAFADSPVAPAELDTSETVVVADGLDPAPLPVPAEQLAFPLEPTFLNGPIPGGGGPGGGGSGGGSGGGGGHYTCDASVTCSGGGNIDPYVLTCQGEYSCSSRCGVVICDGIGTLCFFGGLNC